MSAGDLLRAERNSGSENGELIQHCIKEGTIVPVEITIELLATVSFKQNKRTPSPALLLYTDHSILIDFIITGNEDQPKEQIFNRWIPSQQRQS